MALGQLGRSIRVLSRTATLGSSAHRLHLTTGPSSYGVGASFPSGGAAFSHRRFFCTERPSPPQQRRTQGYVDFTRACDKGWYCNEYWIDHGGRVSGYGRA